MSEEKKNTYDKTDMVRREAIIAGGELKMAAYRVRNPETGELSNLQFHLTFANTIMALMGEESAKLFAKFVTDTLTEENKNVKN